MAGPQEAGSVVNLTEIARDYWEIGAAAIVAWGGFRRKRIESVVTEVMNPALLTKTLTNIEESLSGAHEKLDALAIEVYTLKGRTEAAADEPHAVKQSALPRIPIR